jgi:hypothetical protein
MLDAALESVNTVPYRCVVAKFQTPRSAWVDAATRALAAGGPDAVRIEALAKDLGVSKGGSTGTTRIAER